VLTRVVLWWSAFTALTGMMSNYYLLLLTRFCFGAGEDVYTFFQTWFHTFLVKGRGFNKGSLMLSALPYVVCLDMGRKRAGSMIGLMNTSASVGGLLSSIAYGYIVERFGSYDSLFVTMVALLFLGALVWFKIDASTALSAASIAVAVPVPTR
jgi:MFS family permease